MLENIINNNGSGSGTVQQMYTVNCLEQLSANVLYKEEESKEIYRKHIILPECGIQLHIHQDAAGNVLEAGYKQDGEQHQFRKIDNEQASMADYYADNLNLKTKIIMKKSNS